MKKILLLGIAVLSCTGLFAQLVCNDKSLSGATPEIKTALGNNKKLVNLYTITLPYSADEIKEAVHSRLDAEGLDGSKSKNNFYAFKEVQYTYLWDKTCDLYIAVIGNKNVGSINLIISQGYDNFIDPYKDTITTEKAFNWLIDLDRVVYDYIYEQNLIAHSEELKNIEKELSKLEKKRDKLESKIKKTEKKQLKLEASKTIVSENDIDVDSKKIAKEQKQALEVQKELNELSSELATIETKISQTKGDLNKKKNIISDIKQNKK
jgi:DNA repair exonuclease SbcCD ATPase subunit